MPPPNWLDTFLQTMDYGHYNCRDYYISPHFSPTTIISERNPLYRHESFDELEERSRSPASQKPKFPLLKLPLELRQQIYGYLLPHTQEYRDSGLLGEHARNFSAVKKRAARGMIVPNGKASSAVGAVNNVVWQRGNINLLCVCRQLHDECAEMIYSGNTFLLFASYPGIKFRFRWLLPSGLAPSKSYDFVLRKPEGHVIKLLPEKYMRLIKRLIIHVDHVDSYTGWIKFNVQGKSLTHGLRAQIQCLADALQGPQQQGCGAEGGSAQGDPRLNKVSIRVSNGNAVLDAIKSESVREREGGVMVAEDIEEMLEPFGNLRGVQQVRIGGAVTDEFARRLEDKMRSKWTVEEMCSRFANLNMSVTDSPLPPPLCVYGNDID